MPPSSTPEILYRKEIFKIPIENLPEKLEELSKELMPCYEEGFMKVLVQGLDLFNVNDNEDLQYEKFQQHYYRALHKVVVLHHRFADVGLLLENEGNDNVKYLIQFNKLFEIFYYWEQAIRSLWRVKKASHPLYDSSLNTDIGLFRFKPIDPEINNCYQNLILYLLSSLAERGWRRQVDQCMERIYTKDKFDTHAWQPVMDIQTFVYSRTQKDVNYQQWFNLTSNPTNSKNAIKYLTEVKDLHFIDIVKDRKLFSFSNGIYETGIWENDKYVDRWYPHMKERDSKNKFISYDLCPKRTACKYFNEKFNPSTEEDWYNIPTPSFQSILDYQGFSEDVCRWMYILVCGRILYEVGDMDEWQVMPFLKGRAKSGKSTILTRVCKEFYHPLDVGVLSNNVEKKFGLSAIKDKLLFIAPEIKGNIGLEQCDFQTIISGEDTSVAEKFKTASSVKWVVPGLMAGNEAPGYSDNQGSVSRRLVVFSFDKKVRKGDTQLGKKLLKELPNLILKGNRAYLEAINKYGKNDIWDTLPVYFKETQKDMAEQTNSLVHFLQSGKLKYGPTFRCRQKVFLQAYNEHIRENNLPKCTWKRDFYEGVFEDNGIEIMDRYATRDKQANRKFNCIWLVGVDLVESENNYDEGSDDDF